jgi:hypothetical protein
MFRVPNLYRHLVERDQHIARRGRLQLRRHDPLLRGFLEQQANEAIGRLIIWDGSVVDVQRVLGQAFRLLTARMLQSYCQKAKSDQGYGRRFLR